MNIRLIVVERPGYGLSDFAPNRTLLDWPDDITQLADTLGLEQFSVMGYSGGGAYALACAHRLVNRINNVVLLSSAAPFDIPDLMNDMLDVMPGREKAGGKQACKHGADGRAR